MYRSVFISGGSFSGLGATNDVRRQAAAQTQANALMAEQKGITTSSQQASLLAPHIIKPYASQVAVDTTSTDPILFEKAQGDMHWGPVLAGGVVLLVGAAAYYFGKR